MITTFPSLICSSKITKLNPMYPAAFKSPSKVGLTSRATVSNPIHLTHSSLIVGIFIMPYVFFRFLLRWPNSPGSTQRSKRVHMQGPYTNTTLQSPPEIKSPGDAQRPTKRIRFQEPNTPPTSTQLSSETTSSPKRLPRPRFAPEMSSALLPFNEYLKNLATGQLDIYFESIQPEGITDLGVTLPSGPMLLLHSLGESPDDARLPNLFRNDTVFASV